MRKIRLAPVLLALPILAFGVAGFVSPDSGTLSTRIARSVSHALPREHLSRRTLDEALSHQTFTNYIEALDPERVFFMASDIEDFKHRAAGLHDELSAGNLNFALEVFEIFRKRMRDRVAFVETLLAGEFDLSSDETYRWKRKDAPWAADIPEWNNLWRQRIKNEYLRRVVAQMLKAEQPPAEAKTGDDADAPGDEANAEDDDDASDDDLLPDAFIRDRYVQHLHIIEDSDVDGIMQRYLSAFARAFDPHCDYMSPAAAEDFEIEMKLSLVGIGALLRPEDGTARVASLIPGGPAASDTRDARLRPGDKIIAVAQGDEPPVSIMHWPLYRSVRLIRGTVGSRVVLTVIPASDPTGTTTKLVDLVRDEVKLEEREAKSSIETVTDGEGHERRVGIITLSSFYADMQGKRLSSDYKSSSRDVAAILRKFRGEGVDGVILDLRSNGGGSLIEAVLMTGLFIETGPVVLVRERRTVSILPDNDPTIAYSGPLIVLVNRISASASEIVAAALQDYGRAVIIGDSKTHGKGSVQTIIAMGKNENMGAIKVTNALFYRISGESTQLHGVTPDIVIPSTFEFMEYGEDFLTNPLEWSTVRPVMYSPFDDFSGMLPVLRERSETRLGGDDRYLAYRALLARIEEMHMNEAISLNLEVRKTRARTEKELLDVQNRLLDHTPDDRDAPPDIVREEAMRILADMISIKMPSGPSDALEIEGEGPELESVPDWNRAQNRP